MLAILGILVLSNYFLVYRKAKQFDYYSKRINSYLVILLIVLGYVIMGTGGQMYRDYFK